MDSLFAKTMKKLQENRKLEKSKSILKEDINDDITNIEDVEGFEHDVVTVMDPNLSTEEFIEKQDEVNKLIEETPEGEKVVDTEYVGQKIYTCPLCLTNFYSETEMGEDQKCPVCYETPTEFIYLGTVEQDINDEDEEMLDAAEEEINSTEPAEDEENVDDTFGGEVEGSPEVAPEDEEEEEEETLTASKKISTTGKVIGESKALNENLQVGGSLYFKVKNNIIATEITNVYVDDFNDKTYIQYSNPEGSRSGTMSAEEILKGLEEGTITSENPVPEEEPVAPVEEVLPEAPAEEEPVETFESKRVRAFEFKELSESIRESLLKEGKTEEALNEFWYARNGKVIANKKNAKVVEAKLNENAYENLEEEKVIIEKIMAKYCDDPTVTYDSFSKMINVSGRTKSDSKLEIYGKIGNGKAELLTGSGPNILNKDFIDCLQELYSEIKF